MTSRIHGGADLYTPKWDEALRNTKRIASAKLDFPEPLRSSAVAPAEH